MNRAPTSEGAANQTRRFDLDSELAEAMRPHEQSHHRMSQWATQTGRFKEGSLLTVVKLNDCAHRETSAVQHRRGPIHTENRASIPMRFVQVTCEYAGKLKVGTRDKCSGVYATCSRV